MGPTHGLGLAALCGTLHIHALVKWGRVERCRAHHPWEQCLSSSADAMVVYPADDLINGNILDEMYRFYLEGYDIVAPSRFMKGGSMKNCPLIKEILVRFASFSLFKLSSIPVEDASNGFRLFSKKIFGFSSRSPKRIIGPF